MLLSKRKDGETFIDIRTTHSVYQLGRLKTETIAKELVSSFSQWRDAQSCSRRPTLCRRILLGAGSRVCRASQSTRLASLRSVTALVKAAVTRILQRATVGMDQR